jgi:hypothetical protein
MAPVMPKPGAQVSQSLCWVAPAMREVVVPQLHLSQGTSAMNGLKKPRLHCCTPEAGPDSQPAATSHWDWAQAPSMPTVPSSVVL